MTLMADKFTPEVLLSAPRRSSAIPNSKGNKALFTVTTYSFKEHKRTSQIRTLDLSSGQSTLLYEDLAYSEPTWIGENEFLLFKSGEKGRTSLMLADASKPGVVPKEISTFPAGFSNLKVKRLSGNRVSLACVALSTPAGDIYIPEAEKRSYSTAKVYNSLFVRHWDSYVTENRQTIWYGALRYEDGRWTLARPGLVNLLAKTKLESPVPPFGGTGDFDIGPKGIVFVARDPDLNPALYTKSDVYFVPLESFTEQDPPQPQIVKMGKLIGYSGQPTFSPDGKSVVFTRMRSRQYESDKTRLMRISDVEDLSNVQEFYKTDDGEGAWDARPESITWSADGSELYVTAEKHGKVILWTLPSEPLRAKDLPESLTSDGGVSEVKVLAGKDAKLLLSGSSLVDPSWIGTLDPKTKTFDLVSSTSKQGKSLGLDKKQCDDIWFSGAGDYQVHARVMKPSDFDPSKKYPLAFLIHGGPQGAWTDNWSTRWNPAIFAEQGYVVVCPNPTGSTGYGMELQDGIKEQWGGRPYDDLVKCFDHIEKEMDYVDTNRAVALGASYGGFMINWIQGHDLGRKFKALVYHDGVFSTLNQFATEELFFPLHDFGGTLWENRAAYEKWDPARFTGEWATPQLVIHNELDYRLPIVEGLATFNVLQSRGVPSRLLIFPDENHWVLKPENSLVWHREVLGWINSYANTDNSGGDAVNQRKSQPQVIR